MITYIFFSIAGLFAAVLPIAALAFAIFLVNANKNRPIGFLHLMPYGLLLVIAADTFFSGRSLNHEFSILQNEAVRSPIGGWFIRLCTLFVIGSALERLLNFLITHKNPFGRIPILTVTFFLFWLGSVGLPSFVSAYPSFAHDSLYSLILGLGLLTLSQQEAKLFILASRNALFTFVIISFLCILVSPQLVMQTNYAQGFIPGLPRMAGLAAHAVVFGVLSLFLLILTIKFPFKSQNIQRVAFAFALIGLFLAQSKTVWLTAFQVFAVFTYYLGKKRVAGEPLLKSQIALSLIVGMLISILVIVVISIVGGLVGKVSNFLDSKDGAQLLTLTGRDIIWEFAISEWKNNPIFGYGPGFLNFEHRTSVGLVSAIHAHNQFVDLLARSGLIGLLSVFPYLVTILFLIFKQKSKYRDLAIIAFLIVLNRCVSEVPLSLYGYGHEFLIHILMLAPLLLEEKQITETYLKKI